MIVIGALRVPFNQCERTVYAQSRLAAILAYIEIAVQPVQNSLVLR